MPQNLNIMRDRNVFLIDDDPEFIELVKLQLKGIPGINFHFATDANVGFKMILYYRPDLLILDMVLPDTSGLKLSKAIEIITESAVPTIFISANQENLNAVEKLEFKAPVGVLKKPLDRKQLAQKISEFISLSQSGRPSENSSNKIHYSRPLPIKIIGTLQLIEPVIKIVTLKLSTTFSFATIFSNVVSMDSFKAMFDFWILFPISGLALLAVRKYSYFIFLLAQLYAVVNYFMYESYSWPYLQESPHLLSTIILFASIGTIIYFLLPESRRPFFDPKVRGWGDEPRYKFNLPTRVMIGKQALVEEADLIDISRTGCCLAFKREQKIGESIVTEMAFHNLHFSVHGKILNKHHHLGQYCYGVSFDLIQYGDRKNLKKLIQALHVLHSN